jgi:hypothetical protein
MAFIGNGAQLTDLDAGDIASGTLPLARGGTGTTNTVNTVVAGSGISVSTSGTQVTVSSSGGGGLDAIGSYAGVVRAISAPGAGQSNRSSLGSTIAGSSLRYGYPIASGNQGSFNGRYENFGGSTYQGGGSSLSGTWQCMGSDCVSQVSSGEYCTWSTGLWVRIS